MKKNYYCEFYQMISGRIRESSAACFLLHTVGKTATGIMYAAYPLLLVRLAVAGEYRRLAMAVLVPGLSFVLLSLVRAKINRPRPYETWDIDPLIHKETKGRSMPSRHVFSSAVIAMSWFMVSRPVGAALLIVSAAAACVRVLGGVHYPSDVVVGYMAGVLAGMILLAVC